MPIKAGRVLITTSVICEPCSSSYARFFYTNASKYIFVADGIPFLGFFIGKRGLRADPSKVKAILDWPISKN